MDERCNVYSRRFIDALDKRDEMLPPRGNYIRLWRAEQLQRKQREKEERVLQYLSRRDGLLRKSRRKR